MRHTPSLDPSAEVVFFGDSITAGWVTVGADSWAMFGPAQDLGANSARVADVARAVGVLEGAHPARVVIAVGTNDLRGPRTPGEIADGIAAIADEVHRLVPAADVVVVGILPRAQIDRNTKGRAVNEALRVVLGADVDLVEIAIPVTPDVLPDSLHPSPHGYRLIAEQLAPHVWP